ncbi:MAG: sodium:solute symporter, partial [Ignavibacteria bacterium]
MNTAANNNMVLAGWALIIIYAIIILFFVIRGAKRTKNIKDYAVGNIKFSPVSVGLALAASMTSAATFIINPGFVALYGFSAFLSYAIVLPIAAMVSLVILTKSFRKHGSSVQALTLAQWVETKYKSKSLGLFFGVLSILLLTFIVLIVVGLTKVISKTLDVDEFYALLGVVIFIFGYMMFGGANSMVFTNTIQALLMIFVAFILLGSGYQHFSNGVHGFIEKLSAIDPKLVGLTNSSSFLFRDFFEIVVVQIVIGVAIICQPHIITKSLLLKTDKDVNKYLKVGVAVELLFFLVVFAGFYARLAFPDLIYNGTKLKMDGIIPAYVVSEFPVFIGLIIIMGLLSAGISTLEGLIQSVSSSLTTDVILPVMRKAKPDFKVNSIIINRIIIIALAILTIIISYDQLVNPK